MSIQMQNNMQPGDGQTTPTSSGDPSGQTPNTNTNSTPATTTPSGTQQPDQQQQQPHTSPLTDHWTEADREYIKQLRQEAKLANDKAAALEREKQQELDAQLKEQGKYKELAEAHEARVKELEPFKQQYDELSQLVHKQIDATIKDWPKSVKGLDPGTNASVTARLAWQTQAQAIVTEMAAQSGRPAPGGNSPNPPGVGQNQQQQGSIEELTRRYQSQRGNPF
jgi:hypothetical protein